jgi:5-methylcytosine-specific restriction endonuclease McrA
MKQTGIPTLCAYCQGTEFELRRRTVKNASIQLVFQCLDCGNAASNAIPRATIRSPDSLPKWDDTLTKKWELQQRQERAEDRHAWFVEHNTYLRTETWKVKRYAVLKRAKGLCEGCGSAAATQVHHLTYEHWKQEFLWELVAVCDDCHERLHEHMANRRPA